MKNLMDKFAIFILSYDRADNQITLNTLNKLGYSGPCYLVISDNDPSLQEYVENYGDMVITFNKNEVKDKMDVDYSDNLDDLDAVMIARNYCFEIAEELGFRYFLELDDDYRYISYRYEENGKLKSIEDIPCLNEILNSMLNFMDDTGADAVAFAQGGDFIGGVESNLFKHKISRKLMNSFFFKTDNKLEFKGRQNEDVTLYVTGAGRGKLFLTPYEISIGQIQTQKSAGGMTESYNNNTYVKSFYSVMHSPSNVKISVMGDRHGRIHHKINKKCCYPKILNEKYKK